MMRGIHPAVFLIAIAACMAAGCWIGHSATVEATMAEAQSPARPATYTVTSADMQLPELPTGCEATAGATLLRLNGVVASKMDVAAAMPKSGGDFVHAFWGDPETANGWAIMAPGMCETLDRFLPNGRVAVDLTGSALDDLPVPCQVWTTIALGEPYIQAQQEGYNLMVNTHCMVLMSVGPDSVRVIDPLEGSTSYDRRLFESRYNSCGKQAIAIETREI